MQKQILSNLPLKSIYLENRRGEKVQFLEIDENITHKMLVNEVNGSGKHFESVLNYVDKENKARMVFISAETQELGLMAVAYIAGALGDVFTDTELDYIGEHVDNPDIKEKQYYVPEGEDALDDYEINEQWAERVGRIPTIHSADVAAYYSSNYVGVDFGMTLRTGQNERPVDAPYWTRCLKESICIVFDEHMGRDEINVLNRFTTNKRVYAIYARRQKDCLVDTDTFTMPFSSSESEINTLKNRAVLYNGMDEVQVFISNENRWDYFKDITKQVLTEHGVANSKSIPYDRIVTVAEGIAPANICTAINRLVEYAVKDYSYELSQDGVLQDENSKNKARLHLKKSDFDFLDRFEQRKTLGTKKAFDKLQNDIIGLDEVKKHINQIVNVMKLNKIRDEKGIKGERYHNVHVMLGAPGTAKTTVAQLMGEIMVEEGLLPGRRTIVVNGAQLKGEYVGQSAPKTHALFENFDIIIIDEAYSMVDTKGDKDSFSNESIAQLIIELENHSMDKLVIFAGYGGKDVRKEDNKMQLFLDANPGIQSRINSTIYFPTYTADEMLEVFLCIAKRNQYKVEEGVYDDIKKHFATRILTKDFGNGREARNLLDACTIYLAERVMSKNMTQITSEDVMLIKVEDVVKSIENQQESFKIRKQEYGTSIGFR